MAHVSSTSGFFTARNNGIPREDTVPALRRVGPAPSQDGNVRTLTALQALEAMAAGSMVHRIGGNYHRIDGYGEVQVAESDEKLVAGKWVRAHTDIASWYSSTFRLIALRVQVAVIAYE